MNHEYERQQHGKAMNADNRGLAETARQLLSDQQVCTLATQSLKHPGFPHASIVPFTFTSGRPVFMMSSMATHTRNLLANPKASLLVAADYDDPQSTGRATLLGIAQPVSAADVDSAKSDYLAAHPQAQQWASFGDFAMYELVPNDVYVVAGFGAMGWVTGQELIQQPQ